MSVRTLIDQRQAEVRKPDLLPDRAAEILNELAALTGKINQEILDADMEYNAYLLECYRNEAKANRAKILAETSAQFRRMREARNAREETIEMIRSLKFYLKAKQDEYMHTPR